MERIDELSSEQLNINDIPREILENIFSLLNIKERIKIERVCKYWQYIGTSFQWKIKELKFKENSNIVSTDMTDYILKEIVKRCGNYVLVIDLTGCFSLTAKALSIIGDYCPNLRSIQLGGIPTTNKELQYFSSKCTKLKEAILNSNRHHGFGEKGLCGFLQSCKELEVLQVQETNRISGLCFQFITPKVKKLVFRSCKKLTSEGILKLGNCKCIEHLEFSYSLGFENASLEEVLKQNCNSLKHLGLIGDVVSQGNYRALPFELLTKLESISFEENVHIYDDTLLKIAHSCKNLRTLDISHTIITDIGIKHLTSCPMLSTLNVSFINEITDEPITHLAMVGKLESFTIQGNGNLTDNAVHCTKLKYLDLSSCTEITDETVDSFKKAMKLRNDDHRKLTIIAGGTMIDDFIEEEEFIVSDENLCPIEFRPWFDYDDSTDYYGMDYEFYDYDSDNSEWSNYSDGIMYEGSDNLDESFDWILDLQE